MARVLFGPSEITRPLAAPPGTAEGACGGAEEGAAGHDEGSRADR